MQEIDNNYSSFVASLFRNEPVLIRGVGSEWSLNAHTVWDLFGELCASDVTTPVDLQEDDASVVRVTMRLREFLERTVEKREPGLYLKDLHLEQVRKRCSSVANSVCATVPDLFKDDWLNWYWQTCRSDEADDYSFLYVGGRETVTCVHHDVFCIFSWSVNIVGDKKWTLIPPSHASALFDCKSCLVQDLRPGKYRSEDFPFLEGCQKVVVIQRQKQAIFIPAGWYHMVENLSVEEVSDCLTISVNRNWLKAFNLDQVWLFLRAELFSVRAELEQFRLSCDTSLSLEKGDPLQTKRLSAVDICSGSHGGVASMMEQEWLQHCEVVLKSNAALGLVDFIELISARALMMMLHAREHRGLSLAHDLTALEAALCPRFSAYNISQEDHDVCSLLLSTSHPCLSCDRRSYASNALFPRDSCENDNDTRVGVETTVWDFTCAEMKKVVSSVQNCPEATEHLGVAVCVGLDGLAQLLQDLSTANK